MIKKFFKNQKNINKALEDHKLVEELRDIQMSINIARHEESKKLEKFANANSELSKIIWRKRDENPQKYSIHKISMIEFVDTDDEEIENAKIQIVLANDELKKAKRKIENLEYIKGDLVYKLFGQRNL